MESKKLNIALIQTSLIWENPEENRASFSKQFSLLEKGVDLVVLPEMFSTGFTMSPQNIAIEEGDKTVEWMLAESKKSNIAIVGSILFYDRESYYNRLFFIEPSGKISFYNKRHTFTLAGEDKVYKAGTERLIIEYFGFKICPMICYDLRFPVWARNDVNYDVLIYVANWPSPRIFAWDTLLKARAIENMSYCIGVNRSGVDAKGYEYNGHSAVYDCLGACLTYSEEQTILYTTLKKEHIEDVRNKLKFLNDRDDFNLEL